MDLGKRAVIAAKMFEARQNETVLKLAVNKQEYNYSTEKRTLHCIIIFKVNQKVIV